MTQQAIDEAEDREEAEDLRRRLKTLERRAAAVGGEFTSTHWGFMFRWRTHSWHSRDLRTLSDLMIDKGAR